MFCYTVQRKISLSSLYEEPSLSLPLHLTDANCQGPLGVYLWDSDRLDRIKFIMLLGHKHLLFSFYYIPGIILRVGVSSEIETSFYGVYQQRQTTNKERNKKKMID